MKTLLVLALLAVGLSSMAVTLTNLSVTPGDGRIVVRWETSDENGLNRFVLQRSVDNGEFTDLVTVQPRGNLSAYQYTDNDLYSADKTPRTFGYRLKFVNRDGTVNFSISREATIQISSIRRTWGSIKAMFR
jgi:hypothetical protein